MDRLRVVTRDNTSLAKHLSETDFFLGRFYLNLGDEDTALALFKLTVSSNVHTVAGHRCALLELALSGQGQDYLSESDQQ